MVRIVPEHGVKFLIQRPPDPCPLVGGTYRTGARRSIVGALAKVRPLSRTNVDIMCLWEVRIVPNQGKYVLLCRTYRTKAGRPPVASQCQRPPRTSLILGGTYRTGAGTSRFEIITRTTRPSVPKGDTVLLGGTYGADPGRCSCLFG